jgi:short-subunit dehydrogenase involved in D-alanine esterification of teichoic acids
MIDDALMVATITTNLMGPIRMTSALIEHLKEKSDAVVAYTSSVLGFVPAPSPDLHKGAGEIEARRFIVASESLADEK